VTIQQTRTKKTPIKTPQSTYDMHNTIQTHHKVFNHTKLRALFLAIFLRNALRTVFADLLDRWKKGEKTKHKGKLFKMNEKEGLQ